MKPQNLFASALDPDPEKHFIWDAFYRGTYLGGVSATHFQAPISSAFSVIYKCS